MFVYLRHSHSHRVRFPCSNVFFYSRKISDLLNKGLDSGVLLLDFSVKEKVCGFNDANKDKVGPGQLKIQNKNLKYMCNRSKVLHISIL